MLTVNNLEVSQVVYQASWTESLDNACSVLSFSLPAAQAAQFSCGDTVIFTHGGVNVFYGFLFKVDRGPDQAGCTAYDQLRYLKSEAPPLMRQNETLTDFTARVLAQAGDRIRVGDLADTGVMLPQKLFESGSYLDMLTKSIQETRELSSVRYVLRDEFGAVALRDLFDLRTGIVVGDGSLATDFRYGLSVGDNACNYVKVAKNSSEEGLKNAVIAQNPALVAKWGKLTAFKTLSGGNAAQMKALAENLLAERGKEDESLSVDCVGDLRLRVGCEITLDIAQAGLDFRALITHAEHSFSGAEHSTKLTLARSVW